MIKVSINNICAKLTECEPLTSGMIGKTLDVEFSADWNNYEKTAVFSNGDKTIDVLESEWNGNTINIPHEVLETPNRAVSFGIYGYTKSGDDIILAIPTLYTSLGRVYLGTNPDGDESTEPSLPVWAQIQTEVDDLDDRVTYIEEHGGGGIPDAPSDGKQYARQDGEWTEVQSASGDAKAIGRACYNLLDKAVYIGDETDISALKDALWALVGNTLVSISAVFTQGETIIYPTTSLDSLKTMLVVTAHYDDSTTAEVNDYTLSGELTVGTSVVTVTYSGKTTTFSVAVTAVPTLEGITAVYTQGAAVVYPSTSLDSLKDNLVVTAVYSDSSTEVVNDYTLSGVLAEGTSTITVTYNGKTATFNVNVTAEPVVPTLDYISAVYTQSGEVYEGTALDALKADLVVTAHMTDASTFVVDAADYTLSGTLAEGTSTVIVTYESKTTTFNVTVTAEPTVLTGYTSVGNPNIVANILTPSEGNFIKTPEVFSPNGQSWEIRAKFKFTDINTDYQDVFGGVDVSNASARTILCEFSKPKLNLVASSAGTAWDILETSATNPMLFDISNNTWYWLKFGFDGAKYYREFSTDGVNYSRSEKADLRTIPDGYAIGFGLKRNAVFTGNIDLTECAIDINNAPWWKAVNA